MSTKLICHLNFQLHSLIKVDFKKLFIKTIDHKEIVFHY